MRGLIVIFPAQLPAMFFLGAWFLYQLIEANFGLFGAAANGGGVAFFAHVGGFVFWVIVARVLVSAGQVGAPEGGGDRSRPAPGRGRTARCRPARAWVPGPLLACG